MTARIDRRRFLKAISAAAVTMFVYRRPLHALEVPKHPVPRKGITGDYVLTKKDLAKHPKLIPLFDSVRARAQVFDGIRCSCGCPDGIEFYSLLSCFEARGMARECIVCQDEARFVIKLHKQGKTLNQIRAAFDAEYT
jgi:hypothetical protein